MTTLYLHIGTPKTGTTSLQYLLAHNPEALKKQGACYPNFSFRYPEIGVNRNGHFLVYPQYPKKGHPDRTKPSADYETGLDLLGGLTASFDTLILSDEAIFYYSQYRPDFWSCLREDLSKRGILLKVIIYLRRQDLFLESLYSQRIKWNSLRRTFPEFVDFMLHDDPPFGLDYLAYLDHIADSIGAKNLIVRVFERGQFGGAQKNLYSDFLESVGLVLTEDFTAAQDIRNPRLDGAYLELGRIVNHLPANRPEHHLIGRTMREILDISHPGFDKDARYTYFEPDALTEFLGLFEHSNAEVAHKYLHRPDGVLFCEPIAGYPVLSASDHDLVCCVIITYGKIIEDLSAEIKRLNAEMESLKKHSVLYRLRKFAGRLFKKRAK